MVYIFAILFALGFSWLSSFIWAEYLMIVVVNGSGTEILAHPIASDIMFSSHIILALIVAISAVAPAARSGDAKGAVMSGAALGASVGVVLAGVAWLNTGAIDYVLAVTTIGGAATFTASLAALTYGATDLLLGELPGATVARSRADRAEAAALSYMGGTPQDTVALPFHAKLEKPLPVVQLQHAA